MGFQMSNMPFQPQAYVQNSMLNNIEQDKKLMFELFFNFLSFFEKFQFQIFFMLFSFFTVN